MLIDKPDRPADWRVIAKIAYVGAGILPQAAFGYAGGHPGDDAMLAF